MLPEFLRKELDLYIEKNYREEIPRKLDAANAADTKAAGREVTESDILALDQLIREAGETFHDMLFSKIDKSGMTDVEVYKRANIDRKLFSKIRSNPACHPRKQTVLALAIALKLNLEETVDLLSRAEYALSPGNKGDLIVRYFIEQGNFDLMVINQALEAYGQPVLG